MNILKLFTKKPAPGAKPRRVKIRSVSVECVFTFRNGSTKAHLFHVPEDQICCYDLGREDGSVVDAISDGKSKLRWIINQDDDKFVRIGDLYIRRGDIAAVSVLKETGQLIERELKD
jgi:hypothetical protein